MRKTVKYYILEFIWLLPLFWLLIGFLNKYVRMMFEYVGSFWGILILLFMLTPIGCVLIYYYQKIFAYLYKKWGL